eukprot:2566268-Pleurochrysis_carterae.AAC.1
MRVLWGEAMHPALAQVYHHNRTISLVGMPGSNVGYDMLIEKENLAIAMNARTRRGRTSPSTSPSSTSQAPSLALPS